MEERHLSLGEVAEVLGKNERTIRRWIKSGRLRAYKPGRDYLIPESAIGELIEGSEVFPKLQAPLPLPDFAGARRGAEQLEEGSLYTAFEAFGRVLASTWRDELARWDEKVTDDTDLDTPTSLRFAQWVIGVLETAGAFEAVARHGAGTPRQELADTLVLVKDVTDAVSRKALKQHGRLKTDKRFREIVAANEEPARDTAPTGPSRRVHFTGGPSWAEIASDAFRAAADPAEAEAPTSEVESR